MKRRWAAWFLGLLGVTTSSCDTPATSATTTAELPGGNTPEATAPATPAPSATTAPDDEAPAQSAQPTDPYAPLRIGNMNTMRPLPDFFSNGRQLRGSLTGPINTDQPDRDFFTDPRMNEGENSGRLFYCSFMMENPYDPHIQARRFWFVCWSPLNDGDRAQRLYNRDGYYIEEVTTDGKRLQVRHSAYGSERTRVDVYRWKGDTVGKGRFVLEGSPPPNAIPAKPTPFERERDQGYSLLFRKKFDEAAAAFQKALALKPNDAATHFALGVAYEESGFGRSSEPFPKAIAAFSKAIAADPKRTAAYQHRADLYVFEKKYDLAIADMTRLIGMEPESADGYLTRARAYARKGDYAKAVADTRKAGQITPREDAPWIAMAKYQYQAGQFEAAISTGKKVLALDDSETGIRITIACAYARLGRADLALKTFADAKNNGVSNSERSYGIRELQRFLKAGNPTPAVRSAVEKLMGQFIGPEGLEPLDEDEEISE